MKRVERTNERSTEASGLSVSAHSGREKSTARPTEVLRQKRHRDAVDQERRDLGDNHIRMPIEQPMSSAQAHHLQPSNTMQWGEGGGKTDQVVISRATMSSSLRMRAVKEMETMFRKSVSKRRSDMIMIEPPWKRELAFS
jgi:hypothetical protein